MFTLTDKTLLTHKSIAFIYGTLANSAEPDQILQNVASDQVLHCLLIVSTTKQPLNY